jgi:hypothetical protein
MVQFNEIATQVLAAAQTTATYADKATQQVATWLGHKIAHLTGNTAEQYIAITQRALSAFPVALSWYTISPFTFLVAVIVLKSDTIAANLQSTRLKQMIGDGLGIAFATEAAHSCALLLSSGKIVDLLFTTICSLGAYYMLTKEHKLPNPAESDPVSAPAQAESPPVQAAPVQVPLAQAGEHI